MVRPIDILHHEEVLLLQQIEKGSKDAFNILYEKYWELSFAEAYKRLKDEDLAKDVVQEIFTHIWLKRESLHINNLPAYLNTAIRNRVIKLVTTQKLIHPFFNILENKTEEHFKADDGVLWKEFLQSYESWLATLPPKRQIIFRLRFQEDMPTSDIAKQLGLSRKTVQNQLTKAIEKLRLSLSHLFMLLIILITRG